MQQAIFFITKNEGFKSWLLAMAFACIVYLTFYLYIDWSVNWTMLGFGSDFVKYKPALYQFELPFIFVCLYCVYFPQIKSLWLRFLFPVVLLLILYALFDGFYNYLGRSPFPSDFQNFESIIAFSPWMGIAIMMIFLSIPAIILSLFYLAYKSKGWHQYKWDLAVRIFAILCLAGLLNSQWFVQFHQQSFNYIVWSQEDTIRENGKFSSFYYYFNQEQENKQKLVELIADNKGKNVQEELSTTRPQQLFPQTIEHRRNIHLIVMESFIDPRKLENISFSQSVLADEIKPFLNPDGQFSLVESPIYGGGTAQAEFELLTGVPALALVNKIEFNVMQGGRVDSFVEQLKQNNYISMASIATGTGFFNSKQAYKSLGFTDVSYLETLPQFVDDAAKAPLFDGDVFEHNLEQLKGILNQQQPIFNYVLGMYGHLPFRRDLEKRPDRAEVIHSDERVPKIANQFYYRTKALADYLEQLIALDPDSIILVTSDHLPSILGEDIVYQLDNKINIGLLIAQGKTHDISGKKLYQLPWLLWDLLAANQPAAKRNFNQQQLEAFYYQVLMESKKEES
jgi:hypothetical protein